jgi:hypothetical protein
MTCPYCKETIQDGATKCRFCGSMLNLDTATVTITTDEIRAFVGTNSQYYIQNFSKFTISGTEKFTPTWNWSAFCFTFFWMLYRKMYLQAVVTFFIFCLPGINIILHIVAGVVGNYLYYRHVKDKILEIRPMQTQQNLYPVLQEAGGVHKWVIWAAVILSIMLGIFIILFFTAITATIGKFGGVTI